MDDKLTRETIMEMIATIDKAISMERNAYMFYSKAGLRFQSMSARDAFKKLAMQERRHLRALVDLRNKYAAHRSVKGRIGEITFNSTLSEIRASFKIDEKMTVVDILKEAIKNEKAAYIYYQKKISYTKDPSLVTQLKLMAKDEESHWEYLKAQLDIINAGGRWDEDLEGTL